MQRIMPRINLPQALLTSVLALATTSANTFFSTGTAWAQDEETLKEARANFQKAIELEHARNWGGALKLFREVGQVKMTPQVRYHIATCEENLGQLVAALGGYELALNQAEGMHPDFIAEVEGSVRDLQGRIPKLIIERGEGAEAAAIELDGVQLGESSIGGETPLDPGPHSVSASAPGYEDYRETVNVSEGSVETLRIEMVELQGDNAGAGGGGGSVVVDTGPKDFGPWPYVVGGAGAGSLVLGVTFLALSQGKVGKVKDLCDGDLQDCGDAEAEKLYGQAKTFEAVGWVGVGVGVVGLGAGVAMLVMSSGDKEEPPESTAVRLRPFAPGSDAGLSLVGSF